MKVTGVHTLMRKNTNRFVVFQNDQNETKLHAEYYTYKLLKLFPSKHQPSVLLFFIDIVSTNILLAIIASISPKASLENSSAQWAIF